MPSPKLKKRVDEWRYSGALREHNQTAKNEQDEQHRRQPPPLIVPKERKELANNARATGQIVKKPHSCLLTCYVAAQTFLLCNFPEQEYPSHFD